MMMLIFFLANSPVKQAGLKFTEENLEILILLPQLADC